MRNNLLSWFEALIATALLLISSHALANGGYLFCSTTAGMWKYAGEAPPDFLKAYGTTQSSDNKKMITVENDQGSTFVHIQGGLFGESTPVSLAGYNPLHASSAFQADYMTFDNQDAAKAFCDGLVEICKKTVGDDYYFVALARGNKAEFWAPLSVSYFLNNNASFPDNIRSSGCSNPYGAIDFPNNGGGPRFDGDYNYGHSLN